MALTGEPDNGDARSLDSVAVATRRCARGDEGWCAVVASNDHSAMPVCGVGINLPDYDHREPDCPNCVAALRELRTNTAG